MFSYSGDPSTSDRDEVRYLIQDTDSNDFYLDDAEIDYHINNESNNLQAAIEAAEQIAISLADKADSVDAQEVSAEFREQSERYWKVADKLKQRKDEDGSGLQNVGTADTLFKENNAQFNIGIHDNNEIF